MRVRKAPLVLLALASLLLPAAAMGAPGDLDRSFGNGGQANLKLPAESKATLLDFQRLPDGDTAAVGGRPENGDGYVVRLLANGLPDKTFGSGGLFVMEDSSWNRVYPAGDGLVAMGRVGRDPAVLKLNDQGLPDSSFGTDGLVQPALRPRFNVTEESVLDFTGAGIDSEGRIVAGLTADGCDVNHGADSTYPGLADCHNLALVRLKSDGTLDETFGDGGIQTNYAPDESQAIELAPDDSIGVAAAEYLYGDEFTDSESRIRVTRYTDNGAPMESFGEDGFVRVEGVSGLDGFGLWHVRDIAISEEGEVTVLSGDAVLKLTAAGERDKRYSGDGYSSLAKTKLANTAGVALELDAGAISEDGRVVLAANAFTVGRKPRREQTVLAAVRLGRSGLPDPTFANDGAASLELRNTSHIFEDFPDPGAGLAIPIRGSDGSVTVAGTTRRNGRREISVVRFEGGTSPRLRCRGKLATVQGSPGADVLRAGAVTATGPGNDRILAPAGRVCAGPGNDRFEGGNIGDSGTFWGEQGNDRFDELVYGVIHGGSDDDVIKLGSTISADGDQGSDTIIGSDGEDRISGGAGADRILGGEADDELRGGSGRDRIFGQEGTDRLIGGGGNDLLRPGPAGPRYHRYRYRGQGIDLYVEMIGRRFVNSLVLVRAKCENTGYSRQSTSPLYRVKVNQRTGRFRNDDSYSDGDEGFYRTERIAGRVTAKSIKVRYLFRDRTDSIYYPDDDCYTGTKRNKWIEFRAKRLSNPRQVVRQ